METLTYSSGRASGCDSPGLLNNSGPVRYTGLDQLDHAIWYITHIISGMSTFR